jgi:hypothetical protein
MHSRFDADAPGQYSVLLRSPRNINIAPMPFTSAILPRHKLSERDSAGELDVAIRCTVQAQSTPAR